MAPLPETTPTTIRLRAKVRNLLRAGAGQYGLHLLPAIAENPAAKIELGWEISGDGMMQVRLFVDGFYVSEAVL